MSKAAYDICARILLAIVALAIIPLPTRASVFTWNGGGGDNNWSTGTNWSGNIAPSTASSANDFHFAGTLRLTPNAQAAYSIRSLTFDSGASSFAIGGSTLTIFSGGITNSSTNTETINNAITLGAAQTWNASAGNLTLGGAINNGGFLLTISGASNTTASGVISGSGGLTKNGAGTLTVGAANTYTGPTTVNGGDLSTGTFTLSLSGTVSIASGATYTSTGTLNLTPDTTAAQTFISGAGTLRLRDSSSTASAPDIYWNPTGSATSGACYPVTIASNIDVGTGTRYFNGISNRNDYERYGGDLVFSGNLSGSAGLTFTGTPNTGATGGPWQMAYTLAGNNSAFTGAVILTDGANLTLNNANALTSANSVTFTPSSGAVAGLYLYGRSVTIGALSGTSAGTMNIANGSLVTDTNATINPGIVRSNAVLTVQQNTNTTFNGIIGDGLNDHGAGDAGTYYTLGLTKSGTGTLTLGGTNSYTGTTTISAGTLQFAKEVSLYNNTPGSWTAANIVVASGATAAFNVGGTGEFTSANIDTLKALGTASGGFKSGSTLALDTTNASGGNFTYGSSIANPNGGANVLGLTKLGTGTLTLTGANTYTGGTTINGGTLALGADSGGTQNTAANSLGTGAITIGSGTQLRFGGASGAVVTYNFSNNVTLNNGTILVADGAQHLQGTFTVGSSGGTLTTQYLGKDLYLDGAVSGSGALVIDNLAPTNYGDGQVHFTGSNSYSGTLTINNSSGSSHGGRISVDSNNALANATIVMNGPRDIGFATTAPVFGALSGTGGITLTTGVNLSVGNNNTVSTYSGILTGPGSLTNLGTSTLTLTGVNTYTGGTTINAGTLQLGNANTSSGGALGTTTSASVTFGAGSTGKLQLNGNATTIIDLNTNATVGTPIIENGSSTANAILTVNTANTDTFAGLLQDGSSKTLGLTKSGSGTLILTGLTNSQTGITNINGGILRASDLTTYAAGNQNITSSILGQAAFNGVSFNGNNATLQLRYNGQSDSTSQTLTLPSTKGGALLVNASAPNATIDVDRQGGSGTNKTIAFTSSTIATSSTLNVTGGDGYSLGLGNLVVGSGGSAGNATVNPTTANLTIGTATSSGTTSNHTLVLDGTSSGNTITGAMADGGSSSVLSVTKQNTSSWTLSGANTYTGATTVNAGSLFVNGSTASASAVTVNNSGTTLGGSGTINGTVNVASGTNLSPGATGVGSTAILHTGALTLNSGANFNVTLNGTTAGSGYGQVISPGAITISGANLLITAGSGLAIGNKFFIIEDSSNNANTYGTFANATGGTVITATNNGDTFLISYLDNGDSGTIGNDISLTVTAVPEPATYVAGIFALGALSCHQGRRWRGLLRKRKTK